MSLPCLFLVDWSRLDSIMSHNLILNVSLIINSYSICSLIRLGPESPLYIKKWPSSAIDPCCNDAMHLIVIVGTDLYQGICMPWRVAVRHIDGNTIMKSAPCPLIWTHRGYLWDRRCERNHWNCFSRETHWHEHNHGDRRCECNHGKCPCRDTHGYGRKEIPEKMA